MASPPRGSASSSLSSLLTTTMRLSVGSRPLGDASSQLTSPTTPSLSTPLIIKPPEEPPRNHMKQYIPQLKDYGIHPVRGFMPADPLPLLRLPSYFECWEQVLDDLNRLLLAGRLRQVVLKLPQRDTSKLSTEREWQRAYLVLSFIGQAYIWGKNEPAEQILPANIAVPWLQVCHKLDAKPIISYTAVELYNFKLLDPSGPWDLSNISILHTFSGAMDEAWFYLISLAMEAAGGPAVAAIVRALECVEKKDCSGLKKELKLVKSCIDEITRILVRMYERNDPHIFFNRVRPYVNGWEHNEDLPNGVLYSGVTPKNGVPNSVPSAAPLPQGTFGKYAGASAGQSPTIHVLDLALGVRHFPARTAAATEATSTTSTSSSSSSIGASSPGAGGAGGAHSPKLSTLERDPSHGTAGPTAKRFNFIHEMRNYMVGQHRDFVYAVADSYSIREFCESGVGKEDAELVELFNSCVEGMRAFRDKHIQMVSVYIVIQARKRKEVGYGRTTEEVQTERMQQALLARGTGGTNLMPFLKQTRDETLAAKV